MPRRVHDELVPAVLGRVAVRAFTLGWHPGQRHRHPEAELIVARGEGRRWVGAVDAAIAGTDVCLIAPSEPHCWSAARPGAPLSTVVVQFPADLGGMLAAPALAPLRRLIPTVGGMAFAPQIADQAWQRAKALGSLADPARRLAELAALLALLAEAGGKALAGASAPPANARLAAVQGLVRRRLGAPLPLRLAAATAGMAPTAFARWFRRTTGCTWAAHIAGLRVEQACRLLLETDQPITSVALDAGFGSVVAFNRRFRSATGQAPRSWRQRNAPGRGS